jgi:hypothetical protein
LLYETGKGDVSLRIKLISRTFEPITTSIRCDVTMVVCLDIIRVTFNLSVEKDIVFFGSTVFVTTLFAHVSEKSHSRRGDVCHSRTRMQDWGQTFDWKFRAG